MNNTSIKGQTVSCTNTEICFQKTNNFKFYPTKNQIIKKEKSSGTRFTKKFKM